MKERDFKLRTFSLMSLQATIKSSRFSRFIIINLLAACVSIRLKAPPYIIRRPRDVDSSMRRECSLEMDPVAAECSESVVQSFRLLLVDIGQSCRTRAEERVDRKRGDRSAAAVAPFSAVGLLSC